jgi:hypothetical protein
MNIPSSHELKVKVKKAKDKKTLVDAYCVEF